MTMASDLLAAQSQLLAMGGTPVDLFAPDNTLKGSGVRGAFVNWRVEDEPMRNDYDKYAQKFQMEPHTPEPKKQDYILFNTQRWTILDVHTRIISGQTICHVCVIRK